MRVPQRRLAAALLMLTLALWAPCLAAAGAVSITDDWGHTVHLEQPARRVIPLYGAFTEMLYAIGAGDRVIARTRADAYPAAVQQLPAVGTHMRPNVEMILGLRPDLVIQSASRRAATPEMDRLREVGIPVAVFAPRDFRSVFHTMERLGILTGRAEEAKAVVRQLELRLQAVRRLTAPADHRPSAVFEIRSHPLTVAGTGSMAHQILEAAGARNAVTRPAAVVPFSQEALLALNPDVYIVQEGPMNRNPVPPSQRPLFQRLRAVQTGRVLVVDEHLFSRPGPRCVEAAEILARWLHPDRARPSSPLTAQGTDFFQHPGGVGNQTGAKKEPTAGRPPWLQWTTIQKKLIKPLVRLTLFIAIGLFVGNIIEVLGWTRALGRLTGPVLRWGRLGNQSAVAFMAAFFSGVTANTLLMNAHKDGTLTTRELALSCLVNTLPSYFLHLPTTFFILLPLVREAGILYLAVTLSAALGRTAVTLAVGRRLLPAAPTGDKEVPEGLVQSGVSLAEALQKTGRKFRRRLLRVLRWTLPIYTLFFLLNQIGLFQWLETHLARWVPTHFLPVQAVTVVAFQVMAEFTAGAAAAGALLDAGTLSVKATVLTLLVGNIISTPIRALRHQLPYYMGIYTPRLGLVLLCLGQAVRVASVALFAVLFYLFFPG
ncbi:ABC-type Fe3+-hydroxamate transport system, substrate-binding protein [Desulfacinum hydrothermale DSM 13146]|uniref:ABC-type Fe3+-hydroxamate transport system, substrate-binding protein n=1 Tax=Desulfacinum hydrothermale DSM 13146 TaxID=1121390 RepID=A0A1W1WXP3_9BACT|nr:helical backbone metal receptor [Desulfacinum hydrothermale]SMC16414.1 ABC-type Fe3+-hydroxamate transport system, substrate-binding protein [Desulfacinum hydrothermale DSM 13146]